MSLVLEPSLADLFHDAMVASSAVATVTPVDHTRYLQDPVGWMVDVLGVDRESVAWSEIAAYATHAWDGTPDPIVAAFEHVARGEWVAVSSGTGTGKTFGAGALILWWLAVRRDAIAVTVATKEDQQTKGIWREIGRLWPRFQAQFPDAKLDTLRIRMEPWRGDAWGAWAITAAPKAGEESSTAVQGLHAKDLLAVVDEGPGVWQAIITALVNTMTGDNNVIAMYGNPDHQQDALATFGQLSRVVPLRISALDHPNVVLGEERVPGAVTRRSIQLRADQYGEDGPLYLSRVRGIAPEQAEHALIRLAWCEAAVRRGEDITTAPALKMGPRSLGVDVAQSEAGDLAAIAAGVGACLLSVKAFPCPNATKLGRDVWAIMTAERVAPEHVGVDPIGVGAATVNALDELTDARYLARVVRCNGGGKALPASSRAPDGSVMDWLPDANTFKNLRAQMWWQLREDLRNGSIALPRDPTLFRELTIVQFRDEDGKVTIESKDDIRKRLGKSPDRADAVVYWNWVRPRTRVAAPPPRGVDVARPLSEIARRRPAMAAISTPRYTGWRPG